VALSALALVGLSQRDYLSNLHAYAVGSYCHDAAYVATTTTTTTIVVPEPATTTRLRSAGGKVKRIIIDKNLENQALKEKDPWRKNVVSREIAFTSRFVELEEQMVELPNGELVPWIWVEVQDQVNVVVHRKRDNKFLLFNQTKHGLSANSIAVVGGGVEAGESFQEAAERELLEEMGLKAGKMIPLGVYRVDVNRGMGKLGAFLAYDCVQSDESAYSDDIELQQVLAMSWNQLVKIINQHGILPHGVGEIKWVGSLALAMLEIIQMKNPELLKDFRI